MEGPRPLVRELDWHDPAAAAHRLRCEAPVVLLESAQGDPEVGRYSFLAADPFDVLVSGPEGREDPFRALARALRAHAFEAHPGLPPFQGGAAGFLAYDLLTHLERVALPPDDRGRPTMAMGLFDVVVAYDHAERRCWLLSSGLPEGDDAARARRARERLDVFADALARLDPSPDPGVPPILPVTSGFSRRAYEAAVRRIVEYVLAGDVFQVNLSQRFTAPRAEDPFRTYLRLRRDNPAPFAAFVELAGLALVSASPERFLRLVGERVETRPIKGTRPRGATPEEDAALARALRESAKDRAENVMIVDLLRNDLSRVCRDHGVDVPALCALESYETVHHLVSTVTGVLREDLGAVDLLRAAFPGGSITGAPKVRAMEIVSELEPVRRGPYCGAIGWIGFDGGMDTNIAIRTIVVDAVGVTLHAGGGIVADSDPAAEYDETLYKARALLEALGAGGVVEAALAARPGSDEETT